MKHWKRIWLHFIQAKVYFLESERSQEAAYFEELCGTKEIADFYDMVNSPSNEGMQSPSTTMIYSTLNPTKSLTLNFSIGESSQADSQCAFMNSAVSRETGETGKMKVEAETLPEERKKAKKINTMQNRTEANKMFSILPN